MRIQRGKKISFTRSVAAAAVLLLVVCVVPAGMAMADDASEPETRTEEAADLTYAENLGGAVDATALMVSRAIRDQVFLTEGTDGWDFRTVGFAHPKCALLFFPTEKQQAEITVAFDAKGTEALKPMARAVNSQFSEDYAKLAEQLYTEGDYNRPMAEEIPMAIVLLFYDRHISIVMMEKAEVTRYGAEFLMSDQTVLPTVDESYLPQRLTSMGLTGEFDQVLYNEDQINAIFEETGYNSYADPVLGAAAATEETFVQMAQETLTGPAYLHNSYITADALISAYVSAHEEEYPDKIALITSVRSLSEEALAGIPEWTWTGINLSSEPYTGALPEESEMVFSPDKKILVVSHEEGDEEGEIDYSIMSALPPENLASTVDEADQIIYVDSAWTYSGTNNGIEVYDCKTGISLYDAKTMAQLGTIGSAFNTLSGVVMVSGDKYYPPVPRTDVKTEILNWINGGRNTEETEAG